MSSAKNIIGLLLIVLTACISNSETQIYPKFDFDKISKIEIVDNKKKQKLEISDSEKIQEYADFFKDSSNYFKSEKIIPSGNRSSKLISFISSIDTIHLVINQADKNDRLEIGFLGEPNQLKFQKFNRFYIDKDFKELIRID